MTTGYRLDDDGKQQPVAAKVYPPSDPLDLSKLPALEVGSRCDEPPHRTHSFVMMMPLVMMTTTVVIDTSWVVCHGKGGSAPPPS